LHHHDAAEDENEDAGTEHSSPSTGHEEDAVYLTAPVMLATRNPQPQIGAADFATWLPVKSTRIEVSITGSATSPAHPPPLLFHENCPLYLRALTLLI
jgi:hypothetical protein